MRYRRLTLLVLGALILAGAVRAIPSPAPPDPHRPLRLVGSLAVGFIGDSISSQDTGGGTAPARATALLTTPALAIMAVNMAIVGTNSADWLPDADTAYLRAAISAFRSADVRIVSVALGVNDGAERAGRTPAQYRKNMRAIADALVAAGFVVVLQGITWCADGIAAYGTDYQGRLAAFRAELPGLANGTTIVAGTAAPYAYFAAHPDELVDGLHPNSVGSASLARLWAEALRPLVQPFADAAR